MPWYDISIDCGASASVVLVTQTIYVAVTLIITSQVESLRDQRDAYSRCSASTERRMHSNLLKYYADRVATNDIRFIDTHNM